MQWRSSVAAQAVPSSSQSTIRPKTLPLRDPQAPRDVRRPALSERKTEARKEVATLLRVMGRKWGMSERDLSLVAEVSRQTVDDVLEEEKPMHVETILLFDDAHALELLDALVDLVRARRRARSFAHR